MLRIQIRIPLPNLHFLSNVPYISEYFYTSKYAVLKRSRVPDSYINLQIRICGYKWILGQNSVGQLIADPAGMGSGSYLDICVVTEREGKVNNLTR